MRITEKEDYANRVELASRELIKKFSKLNLHFVRPNEEFAKMIIPHAQIIADKHNVNIYAILRVHHEQFALDKSVLDRLNPNKKFVKIYFKSKF